MFQSFMRIWASDGLATAFLQGLDFLLPDWLFCASGGEILRKDLVRPQAAPLAFQVRWATADDLAHLKRFERYYGTAESWIEAGDRCAVAICDGQVAGFECYRGGAYRLPTKPWIRVDLGQYGLWTVFSCVAPPYRGQGVAQDVLAFAAVEFRAEGISAIYDHIFEADGRATRAHAKRGFLPIDRWHISRVFGYTLFRTASDRRIGRWSVSRPLVVPASGSVYGRPSDVRSVLGQAEGMITPASAPAGGATGPGVRS